MKNLVVLALVIVSSVAFAGSKLTAEQKACIKTAKANKELKGKAKKEAISACKAAPAQEAKTETKEVAPATAPAAK